MAKTAAGLDHGKSDGLVVRGICTRRYRRIIPGTDGKPDRQVRTYEVASRGDGTLSQVQDWSDGPAPTVGEPVELRVEVRTFQTRSGPRFSLERFDPTRKAGVEF